MELGTTSFLASSCLNFTTTVEEEPIYWVTGDTIGTGTGVRPNTGEVNLCIVNSLLEVTVSIYVLRNWTTIYPLTSKKTEYLYYTSL